MIGPKPVDDLCLRIQNRFAHIALVTASPFDRWSAAPCCQTDRAAPARDRLRRWRRDMKRSRAFDNSCWPAAAGDCCADIAAQPVIKFGRLHHDNLATHARVIHAAVLGAEQVVTSRAWWLQTIAVVYLPGHDVRLDPKRRNEEVVNHVFGGHDQFDLAADRHVQFVDLALAGRVLKLPHPLLADDVNLDRVLSAAAYCAK